MQAIMQIFLARNNVQAGPYTLEQLNIMLASGEVLLDDLIWHEGLDQWVELHKIAEVNVREISEQEARVKLLNKTYLNAAKII